jgi:membrane peptidoglycan carboxypeptidase
LPNPHRFSATANDNQRMNRKRKIIAARMLRRHWIEQVTYDQALAEMGL